MPVYQASSKSSHPSGVPFGGIGAGKFEILPNGLWNAFTFENNWSQPLLGSEKYPGVLGYHLGISSKPLAGPRRFSKEALLLQTVPVRNCPTVKGIRYEGAFPRARLFYETPGLGLEISLEVFSPWIPGDAKRSSLPAAFFTLRLQNRSGAPVEAGCLFIGRNVSGAWCVGRQNLVEEEKDALHLEFLNRAPGGRDPQQGSLRFSFLKENWRMSFIESWNAVTRNFSFGPENISLEAWEAFVRSGALPNSGSHVTANGENQELCGAVAAHQVLRPGEAKALSFTAAWHFPHHPLGHHYQRDFKDAASVSKYVLPRREAFRRKVEQVEKAVLSFPFPEWFNDALLTNLAPFFASTWYVKDGRFAFYEAPVICPLMGTLDVGFYGSIPLGYFFQELELSQIRQFAEAQRPDGYIPHDLGKNRIDLASNGTTFYLWKDLNPKFILMVYRDFLWSGDRAFLKEMFPHVKHALSWSLSKDDDGNGLPDHEGADQTFDLWEVRGAFAYTSSILLAALLACERMGKQMKDVPFAREARERFGKAKESFEKELWNGKFFGKVCALSQLNGQWYADLLDLGWTADPAKIRKAISHILTHNGEPSRFGLVNSVNPDGSLDASNDHSKNIWSGMNYAFMSLCISQGFPLNKLLREGHKLWNNIVIRQRNAWNLPDTIDSETGEYRFGDSYYRNMAIWSIPIAYAKRDQKTRKILQYLRTVNERP